MSTDPVGDSADISAPANDADALLARIRIVLTGTQHPGNIGAAARAMKNMGLSDLALVAPRKFPHADATAMASGADDLLANASIHMSLAEALADCAHVVATSARPRYISVPVGTPREWTSKLASGDCPGRIALVFGRERTGLTNEELQHAQQLLVIPTGADYSSLNLAAAVQILCYELRLAASASAQPGAVADTRQPVDQQEMERFYEHLQSTLVMTQFLDPASPRFLMRRLRRLYSRAAPDAHEINILRGILTSFRQALERARGKRA